MIISDKMQSCKNYIQALEEERGKIQVFQRELPLCFELVTQAIEACKQQLLGTSEYNLNHGQTSECNSEQTSSDDVPVLEEFIPIKRCNSSSNNDHSDDDEDEQESNKKYRKEDDPHEDVKMISTNGPGVDKISKKSDWLRSVQLWNPTPDPPTKEVSSPRKMPVVEVKRKGNGGAFHPFKKEKISNNARDVNGGCNNYVTTISSSKKEIINSPPPPVSTSSTAETGGTSSGGNKKEEKEGQSQRKARRCWSPELHKRFLQALHQLGGSHVATPKQIRESMKVDGLTNDEVKSHLQKYRLHTRRPSPSTQSNHNVQTPQFVVVGGIWVPPEYAATVAATTTNSGGASGNGIYAPIARLPPPFDQDISKSSSIDKIIKSSNSDNKSNSDEDARSHSPATSSSTHTTTASPTY